METFGNLDDGAKFWRTSIGTILSGPYVKRSATSASDMVGCLFHFDPDDEVRSLPLTEQQAAS